jgi:hypothetical protein
MAEADAAYETSCNLNRPGTMDIVKHNFYNEINSRSCGSDQINRKANSEWQ